MSNDGGYDAYYAAAAAARAKLLCGCMRFCMAAVILQATAVAAAVLM